MSQASSTPKQRERASYNRCNRVIILAIERLVNIRRRPVKENHLRKLPRTAEGKENNSRKWRTKLWIISTAICQRVNPLKDRSWCFRKIGRRDNKSWRRSSHLGEATTRTCKTVSKVVAQMYRASPITYLHWTCWNNFQAQTCPNKCSGKWSSIRSTSVVRKLRRKVPPMTTSRYW